MWSDQYFLLESGDYFLFFFSKIIFSMWTFHQFDISLYVEALEMNLKNLLGDTIITRILLKIKRICGKTV